MNCTRCLAGEAKFRHVLTSLDGDVLNEAMVCAHCASGIGFFVVGASDPDADLVGHVGRPEEKR